MWAEALTKAEALRPKRFNGQRKWTNQLGPYLGLSVMEDGKCSVEKNYGEWLLTAPPDVMLDAARWIFDTFGEGNET